MRLRNITDLGVRFLLLTLGLAALVAAVIALDLARPASAQSDEQSGRIVARLLDDGRVEFGWQPTGGTRVLPEKRYFPASIDHNRWLRSSPVEVDGAEIGRINARQSEDGRIEFAFTPTNGERILTDARYFPTNARANRWLRSTEITISTGPIPFIAVSAFHLHTCGLRENGETECWGWNEHGQADAPEGHFVAAIDAYTWYTCGLRENGEIECWGDNSLGRATPPEGKFTAISTGHDHACGLRESGEIACWGSNVSGERDAPQGSFTAISVGGQHTCAIAETFDGTNTAADTGEIECWGRNTLGQTDAPVGRFRAVSAGIHHTCAIRTSGEIECWGRNTLGQTNAPTGIFTAVSATAGYDYTCAIRENKMIACWGSDRSGQAAPPAGSYTTISAGGGHACAIRDTGEIACWGNNQHGQSDTPPGTFTAVSAGWDHACAIRENGEIECWGDNTHGQSDTPTDTVTVEEAVAGQHPTCTGLLYGDSQQKSFTISTWVGVSITVTCTDPDGSDEDLRYSAASLDASIASIEPSGNRPRYSNPYTVRGVGMGTTTVTVTATDSDGLSGSVNFSVTVLSSGPHMLGVSPVTVAAGGREEVTQLSWDQDGDRFTITASSSNPNVASVSVDGTEFGMIRPPGHTTLFGGTTKLTVTGVSEGVATISVSSRDVNGSAGPTISFGVTVRASTIGQP